jgi:hypothetical protein
MSRTTRRIRIAAASVMVAAGLIGAVAAPASAGKPTNQACVGESLSALASNQPSPGAFGGAIRSFAQAPDGTPGIGDGVQSLQAGDVPNDVLPNTCND